MIVSKSEVKDRLELYGGHVSNCKEKGGRLWLSIVTYACDPRIWYVEAGGSEELRVSVG